MYVPPERRTEHTRASPLTASYCFTAADFEKERKAAIKVSRSSSSSKAVIPDEKVDISVDGSEDDDDEYEEKKQKKSALGLKKKGKGSPKGRKTKQKNAGKTAKAEKKQEKKLTVRTVSEDVKDDCVAKPVSNSSNGSSSGGAAAAFKPKLRIETYWSEIVDNNASSSNNVNSCRSSSSRGGAGGAGGFSYPSEELRNALAAHRKMTIGVMAEEDVVKRRTPTIVVNELQALLAPSSNLIDESEEDNYECDSEFMRLMVQKTVRYISNHTNRYWCHLVFV